jgi:hypothetical protein
MRKIIPDGNVFHAEKTFEKILDEAYFVKSAIYRAYYQGFPWNKICDEVMDDTNFKYHILEACKGGHSRCCHLRG